MKEPMRKLLGFLCLILVLFLEGPSYSQGQAGSSALFEKLCAAHQKTPSPANQKRLLSFCEKNQASSWAGLGYFRLGYQDYQDEKYSSAVMLFERAANHSLDIDDFLYFYWGEALLKNKQPEQAMQRFDVFFSRFPDSPFRGKALSSYREAALAANRPEAVLDSLKFTSNVAGDPDALFYAAAAQEASGQFQTAMENYKRVYYLFPLFAKVWAVSQRINELSSNNPSLVGTVSMDWRTTRIEKLYSAKRFSECLKDLRPLLNANPDYATNSQYQLWLGISQYGVGDYLDAVETFKRIYAADNDLLAHAEYVTAECYRKLDDFDRYRATVDEMETRYPSSKWFEEALFSLGNYHLVRRNLNESTALYQKLLSFFPQGEHADDAHWRVSWQCYRQKDYTRASQQFLEHLGRFKQSPYATAAIYWAARAREQSGQEGPAISLYQLLVEKTPNSYYGQLAGKRMGNSRPSQSQDLFPDLLQAVAVLDLRGKEAAKVNWQLMDREAGGGPRPRVKALAMTQLFDLAASELMRKEVYGDSPLLTLQAARLYYKGKRYPASIVLLRKIVPGYLDLPFDALPRPAWEMFYPADYYSVIDRECRRYNLDLSWVLSLIRQESSFNPRALSSANAHGLMQLLPSTAGQVARQMKLRRPTPLRLFEPELNIRLGTRHFSDLLKKFDGQMEMTLASYNAGADRVTVWTSEGGFADNAEFVENIPFTETRNYVKIISRGSWFYGKLYGR
jgi:soluble lytic murein transglycosylase